MPTQLVHENVPEIRAKIAYNGEVLITYINQDITLEGLCQEMREICRFSHDQVFTMKWVDEEGDPCTISTQLELDEAIRLYEMNRDSELTVHGKFIFFNAISNQVALLPQRELFVCKIQWYTTIFCFEKVQNNAYLFYTC